VFDVVLCQIVISAPLFGAYHTGYGFGCGYGPRC